MDRVHSWLWVHKTVRRSRRHLGTAAAITKKPQKYHLECVVRLVLAKTPFPENGFFLRKALPGAGGIGSGMGGFRLAINLVEDERFELSGRNTERGRILLSPYPQPPVKSSWPVGGRPTEQRCKGHPAGTVAQQRGVVDVSFFFFNFCSMAFLVIYRKLVLCYLAHGASLESRQTPRLRLMLPNEREMKMGHQRPPLLRDPPSRNNKSSGSVTIRYTGPV